MKYTDFHCLLDEKSVDKYLAMKESEQREKIMTAKIIGTLGLFVLALMAVLYFIFGIKFWELN